MAGLVASADSGEVASGTGTKTILQIAAPTNQKVRVNEIGITCKGTNPTQLPIRFEVLRQTTAGTSTSVTPKKTDDSSNTVQTTAGANFTAEPTAGDILREFIIHPQSGMNYTVPGIDDLMVPGGGRLGIRALNTGGTDTTVVVNAVFEE